MTDEIRKLFSEKFDKEPLMILSPGRVNLIGEHTDYNQGYVLPAAVDKFIFIAMAISDSPEFEIYSVEYDELYRFSARTSEKATGWKSYVLGMVHYIQEKTGDFENGIQAVISGNIPVGGGMSSSAALCSGLGVGLNHLFDRNLSKKELAILGQQTEHNYAGVKCGIMDQFAVLHGKKGNLIKLDCRDLSMEYIPFDFPEYRIVLVNTMVSHSLAETEYNLRRQQCEDGVAMLKHHFPGIMSLRDVQPEMLAEQRNSLPEIIFKRCKYVVEEKERLLQGCVFLKQGDIDAFGKLMYQTHDGLSRDYGVSCAELDFLVAIAQEEGIIGSRMMGGGFGGCTINLVKEDKLDSFSKNISHAYLQKFDREPEIYITRIEDGTRIL